MRRRARGVLSQWEAVCRARRRHGPTTLIVTPSRDSSTVAASALVTERTRVSAADVASLVVIFLDIDHCKDINDRLRCEARDQLLGEIAVRLATAGDDDVMAQVGGDEFTILAAADHHCRSGELRPRRAASDRMIGRPSRRTSHDRK